MHHSEYSYSVFLRVVVVAQAILGEIELDRLINKLMGVVMENTGATKCLLILGKGNEQFVKAQAVIDDSGTEMTLFSSLRSPLQCYASL